LKKANSPEDDSRSIVENNILYVLKNIYDFFGNIGKLQTLHYIIYIVFTCVLFKNKCAIYSFIASFIDILFISKVIKLLGNYFN